MTPEESQKLIYYYQNLPEAALPSVPNWRHYKLRFFDGTWKSIDQTIATIQDLRNQIVTYSRKFGPPKDVYYSVGRWLSPATLTRKRHRGRKGKEGYGQFKWGDNNFLGCELVLDFDLNEDETSFKRIESMLYLIEEVLKLKGFSKFSYVRTGFGVQMHIDDWEEKTITKIIPRPGERENYYKQMMSNFVKMLKTEGLVFDFNISEDPRRMVRLPLSIYGKTMKLCTISSSIKWLCLSNPAPQIKVGQPTIRPAIPCEGKMTPSAVKEPSVERCLA